MNHFPFYRHRLLCPGPTPVPKEAALASLETDIYHRSFEFKQEILKARNALQSFFDSTEPPLLLSSSGSGAMEAAVVNLSSEHDKVIVINGGKFGERWLKLCNTYLCNTIEITVPWGQAVNLDTLRTTLQQNKDTKAVFIQGNETSTGVAHPIEAIGKIVQECSDALFVVDGISALVAHKISMKTSHIDCLLSGSQKGFGVPPGLSFVALSEKAWSRISTRPKFYFDLKKERKGQDSGATAWTPATSLIQALNVSLEKLLQIGVSGCEQYHQIASKACQAAAKALNLELFSQSYHSHALTAIMLPNNIDGIEFLKHARRKYGVIFAGGQDQAKGKIIRIAHLGFFDSLDLISAISALEFCLADFGHSLTFGQGVSAAMEVFHSSSS